MNKVTLLAIIALTMIGSLVFKAWQQAPVRALAPQSKPVAVASAAAGNEEFRARLRQIVARAKASTKHVSADKQKLSEPAGQAASDKASEKIDKPAPATSSATSPHQL